MDASLLKYKASEIAAASLILSSKSLKKVNVWNKEMERATEYTDEYLQPIAEDVKSFVVEVNPKFLTTLKYKFSKQEYKEVANLPFKFRGTVPTASSSRRGGTDGAQQRHLAGTSRHRCAEP